MSTQESVIHDVEVLARLLDESGWRSLHVVVPGFELRLSKDPRDVAAPVTAPAGEQMARKSAIPSPTAVPAPATATTASIPDDWQVVAAPTLGTFYRSPKPGQAPFVEVGQAVATDTELCLVEVMKLFTTVRAGAVGVIRRVCVEDGALVEHGQALFLIEPAA